MGLRRANSHNIHLQHRHLVRQLRNMHHRVRDVLHIERRLDEQAVLEGAIGVEGAIRLLRARLVSGHEFGLGVP